jgi:hypothetical protein
MFATITSVALRLAAIRWAIKSFVGLGLLVPLAFVLKFVGLPVLIVLGVLAAPVMFVLFLLGLPVFLVLIVAALLMAGLFFVLTIGLIALKIFLFVILPVWLVWTVATFFWRMIRPASGAVGPAGSAAGSA